MGLTGLFGLSEPLQRVSIEVGPTGRIAELSPLTDYLGLAILRSSGGAHIQRTRSKPWTVSGLANLEPR